MTAIARESGLQQLQREQIATKSPQFFGMQPSHLEFYSCDSVCHRDHRMWRLIVWRLIAAVSLLVMFDLQRRVYLFLICGTASFFIASENSGHQMIWKLWYYIPIAMWAQTYHHWKWFHIALVPFLLNSYESHVGVTSHACLILPVFFWLVLCSLKFFDHPSVFLVVFSEFIWFLVAFPQDTVLKRFVLVSQSLWQ